MASSSSPLLADPRRNSYSSSVNDYNDNPNEETSFLRRVPNLNLNLNLTLPKPTLPSLPLSTTFHPTLHTRSLALILIVPSFILFTLHGPAYAPTIVFLSFAIFRQLVILISHFGSQIVVIRIEVVHHRLKAASAKAQEKWIKRGVAAAVDAGILIGMLVTLALVAWRVDNCGGGRAVAEAGVILGFLAL
jgi:hypothetical protein